MNVTFQVSQLNILFAVFLVWIASLNILEKNRALTQSSIFENNIIHVANLLILYNFTNDQINLNCFP